MSVSQLNPVQRRIRTLEGIWNAFSEIPDARILRWLLDTDEMQIVQLFVELQAEEVSEIPDLFLELRSELHTATDWTSVLVAELSERYAAEQSGLESLGIVASWVPPVVPAGGGPEYLVSACEMFHRQLSSRVAEHLVIVLIPSAVVLPQHWVQWMTALAGARIPEFLRFMVVDTVLNPQLDSVAAENPLVLRTVRPELEMHRAWGEILDTVPGDTPGHVFRRYFVALTTAAGRADTAAAELACERAVRTALAEQWHGLAATAQMAAAAAWFAAGRLPESIERYRQACMTAESGVDLASISLLVPTRMAEGSALIAGKQFAAAAESFEKAAVAATSAQNLPQQLEAWRMAGWCYEQVRRLQQAEECGEKALQVAAGLDAEQRRLSHLPWVGQMLLRLADASHDRAKRQQTEQRMLELLGPEWTAPLALGRT